jgi:hypothetical protein
MKKAKISAMSPRKGVPPSWVTVVEEEGKETLRKAVGYEAATNFCHQHGLELPYLPSTVSPN